MKPLRYLVIALITTALAFAGQGKKAPEFGSVAPTSTVTVIVQFKALFDSLPLQALGLNNSALVKSFTKTKIGVYKVPAFFADAIAALPGVKYISIDRPLKAHLDITDATVGANLAYQYGWTGQGIGVAVIDSGVTPNADLQGRVVYNQSFIANDSNPADAYGHGTHVAGIIAGNGANSQGTSRNLRGIAPNVNIINLRVLDQTGAGTDSAVIGAIEQAIALKDQYNIRVINLSLGRPISESFQTDPLCQAVESAYQAGITVLVAAGNNGRDNSVGNQGYWTINSPANDPFVITVGAMKTEGTATRADDLIASYSSKGPTIADHIVKPDILAPGNLIASLRVPGSTLDVEFPQNQVQPATYGGTGSPVYFNMSGTSMATPVVAGAAALLLQQNPNMTPDQIKARLMLTATKTFPAVSTATDSNTGATYTDYYDIFAVGAGYVDVYAALSSSALSTGVALSPTAVYNSATNSFAIVADSSSYANSISWGSGISWGDSTIWGATNLTGAQSISWGSGISWGDSIALASGISWGDSTSTAFHSTWATGISWGDLTPVAETAILRKGEK